MSSKLRFSSLAILAVVFALGAAAPTRAEDDAKSGASVERDNTPQNILFIQQDKVVKFDLGTGIGAQVGTATGAINGVSIVNFAFTITSFPNFTFDNRAGITDIDGDQIIFKNVGTGRFIIPGLSDPTVGGTPGTVPFQVFNNGFGGPFVGTYEVVATSGKYVKQYPLGKKFPYRAVAMNPSSPPSAPGELGAVYVEIFRTDAVNASDH